MSWKRNEIFFRGNLDSAAEWRYTLEDKSVEREKYRPTAAQRAWHMLRAGTGTERERTPGSCKLNPPWGSRGAAGRALQRQRFKGERVRKSDRTPGIRLR